MKARDIIKRWPSKRLLADDAGRSHITVHDWYRRNSIPAELDVVLVAAARRRGIALSYEELALMRNGHDGSP